MYYRRSNNVFMVIAFIFIFILIYDLIFKNKDNDVYGDEDCVGDK